jgi:hypothetical protein
MKKFIMCAFIMALMGTAAVVAQNPPTKKEVKTEKKSCCDKKGDVKAEKCEKADAKAGDNTQKCCKDSQKADKKCCKKDANKSCCKEKAQTEKK